MPGTNNPALLSNNGFSSSPTVKAHIVANDDVEAINEWLKKFTKSPNTQASYAREANRFLIWLHDKAGDPGLRSVNPLDTLAYAAFLANPDAKYVAPDDSKRQGWQLPHDQLLGASNLLTWRNRVIALGNEGWRPFRKKLGEASEYQSKIVLFSMYKWLQEGNYVAYNPFKLYGLNRSDLAAPDRTAIGAEARRALVTFARARADIAYDSQYAARAAERDLWVITIVLLTGARRNEIASGLMSDFFTEADGWVWRIRNAKGNKEPVVPVTDELIAGLARYRKSLGLTPTPSTVGPDAEIPLVADVRNRNDPTGYKLNPNTVNAIVKSLAKKVIGARILAGAEHNDDVNRQLGKLVLHGLRHTAATGMVEAGASLNICPRIPLPSSPLQSNT